MRKQTTKTQMNKLLGNLQKLQRKLFKKGSLVYIQIKAEYSDNNFIIIVTAYNQGVERYPLEDSQDVYHFQIYTFYSFCSLETNQHEVDRMNKFLSLPKGSVIIEN